MRHSALLSSSSFVLLVCAAVSTVAAAAPQRLTPQGSMRALAEAIETGNEAAIAECFYVEEDADGAVVASVSRQLLAGREYWKAVCRTFGRRSAIEAYVKRKMVLPDGYLDYPDAKWTVEGDRATLVRKDDQSPRAPSPLRRVDGKWLVDVAPRSTPEERNRIITEMDRAARRFSDAAAAIENGDFESVHDAIESLYPHQRLKKEIINARPILTKEQLDPSTIAGSVMSLGQAIDREDSAAAVHFYFADAPGGDELIAAHVRRLIAVNRFGSAVSDQIEGNESLEAEFELIDARDDFFGHLTTNWKTEGERATGAAGDGAETTLVRREGAWRIDLTPREGDGDARSIASRLDHQTRAVADVTRAVKDRQIFTSNEVRQALKRAGLTPIPSSDALTEASHTERE